MAEPLNTPGKGRVLEKGDLTIEKSLDLDGDGIFDESSERSLTYTPSSTYTDMGEHVAAYEDTVLPPTDTLI